MNNRFVPSDPKVRNAWIGYQLKAKGLSYSQLGRMHGFSVHAPRQALYRKYPRMEQIIAEAIGMRPEEIWPERYSAADRYAPSSSLSEGVPRAG